MQMFALVAWLTKICEVIVVCDLDFLDEIQVQQEDGWLGPIPEHSKPVAFEGFVVRVESFFEARTQDWPVSPEPVGLNRREVTPLFELILKIRID